MLLQSSSVVSFEIYYIQTPAGLTRVVRMPGVAQNTTVVGLDDEASMTQIRARHPTEPIVLHQSGYVTAADSVKQHSETEPSANHFHLDL